MKKSLILVGIMTLLGLAGALRAAQQPGHTPGGCCDGGACCGGGACCVAK